MRPAKKLIRRTRRGVALIISMIFVLIFAALAVSMATMSGTNVQIAENLRKNNRARASAESGLQVTRFWLNRIAISGLITPSQIFTQMANSLQDDLTTNGITNITTSYDSSTITIPSVILNSNENQNFAAAITQLNAETLQIDVTGTCDTITRTIRADYNFETRVNSVFNYGVATKGPLELAGNVELTGINIAVEADVYIESENQNEALSIIGNSQIAGDVKITNPDAYVTLQGGQAGIGGEIGQDAIDNHVSIGEVPAEFPEPNPTYFEQYIQTTFDANTVILDNITIPPNTNPTFSADTTLRGIVFIEVPNTVTFSGHVDITGIIVGNGSIDDNSGENQINFLGSVTSAPVAELPDEPQFTQIKDETGTFLIAPGFSVSMGGNFDVLNGAIAANGIEFFGDAGGTINGSILNYSDNPMTLSGNSDLYFNRSGTVEIPAGFVPEIILQYDPNTYSEIIL